MIVKMKKAFKKIPYLKKGVNYIQSLFPNYFIYTKEFHRWYDFIEGSQWWSKERLREYQWKKLKELLIHCYYKVPYYQKLFRDLDANPEDFSDFDDFKKFPFLTKEIVRERLDEFIPIDADKEKLIFFTTGGSTGEPLGFYKTRSDDIKEQAFIFNQWSRVGFKPGDTRLAIRGDILPKNKLWEYYPLKYSWVFSQYNLSKKHIGKLVKKINEIRPKFLQVYPSSLWLFVDLMKEENLEITFSPKAIFCGSSKLYPFQRKLFEEVFHSRAFSWLGLAEQTVLAGECEKSQEFHIFSEHSYVELVDEGGNKIDEAGVTGEIVGTNFYNIATPFIRYKTGDLASYSEKKECECGRAYRRIKDVEGRVSQFVFTKKKEKFLIGGAIFGIHDRVVSKVRRFQFIQDEVGRVIIKVEKRENIQEDILRKELSKFYKERFRDEIDFEIIFTKDLKRSKRGKNIPLIRNIPEEPS